MRNVQKDMQLGKCWGRDFYQSTSGPVLRSAPLSPIARQPEDILEYPYATLSLPLSLWAQEGPSECSPRAVQGTAGLA